EAFLESVLIIKPRRQKVKPARDVFDTLSRRFDTWKIGGLGDWAENNLTNSASFSLRGIPFPPGRSLFLFDTLSLEDQRERILVPSTIFVSKRVRHVYQAIRAQSSHSLCLVSRLSVLAGTPRAHPAARQLYLREVR